MNFKNKRTDGERQFDVGGCKHDSEGIGTIVGAIKTGRSNLEEKICAYLKNNLMSEIENPSK